MKLTPCRSGSQQPLAMVFVMPQFQQTNSLPHVSISSLRRRYSQQLKKGSAIPLIRRLFVAYGEDWARAVLPEEAFLADLGVSPADRTVTQT
jgi:hypothetical protein